MNIQIDLSDLYTDSEMNSELISFPQNLMRAVTINCESSLTGPNCMSSSYYLGSWWVRGCMPTQASPVKQLRS